MPTPRKHVAKTIHDIAKKMIGSVLDRSADVSEMEATLLEHWGANLYDRKPAPAFLEAEKDHPTRLDLSVVIQALAEGGAVISLPADYQRSRPKTTKSNETRVSKSAPRYGKILGLSANRETFKFSVLIQDMSILSFDKGGEMQATGAPRYFSLTDDSGEIYEGWGSEGSIEFFPSEKMKAFFNEKQVWTDENIDFAYFVHPNRWRAFYGQYYLLTKVYLDRLAEERDFVKAEVARLKEAGIKIPSTSSGNSTKSDIGSKPTTEREEGGSKTIECLEAEVDVPAWTNSFKPYEKSVAGLQAALDRQSQIGGRQPGPVVKKLDYAARSVELAFYKRLKEADLENENTPIAAWIKNAEWESGYKLPRSPTQWYRLTLSQVFPATKSLAIRYRLVDRTVKTA